MAQIIHDVDKNIPEIPKILKCQPAQLILNVNQKVAEIPQMPEIHKMLNGLDKAYWVISSMLLIRKFLKFPKILKCQLA